jgi:hypothetical protein
MQVHDIPSHDILSHPAPPLPQWGATPPIRETPLPQWWWPPLVQPVDHPSPQWSLPLV